ncbi:MAG: hypothetical protein HQ567_16400 [Candidatus Nealsonbacteria bacterium]|nr:hypothetical protein [Candidatus Nealsonbacteria bacterium]
MNCTPSNPICRRLTTALALPAILLLGGMANSAMAADRPSAVDLLPKETLVLLSVPDAVEMSDRFMNTAIGRMSQDPQLKPLAGEVYGAVTEVVSQFEEAIGLSLPQLLALPQGELTVALVSPEIGPPALVVLFDVGDQLSNARKLLDRGIAELERSGATRSQVTVAKTKITVYDGVGPEGRAVAFFEKDSTMVFSSDAGVIKGVLAAWNGGKADVLADNPNYAAIMRRCQGAKDEQPHFLWFVDPVGILRKIAEENFSLRIAVASLPALGLDGLSGIGGSVILDTEQFDSVIHAHILLESPRSGVVKMIALRTGKVTPEPWVPAEVASYTTLHWDVQETYTSLTTLYDSFRGDGALAAMVQAQIVGPSGIDLEKDILPSLEGRITIISSVESPLAIRSQGMLVGFKLKDTEAVAKALEKLQKMSNGRLVVERFGRKKYYRVVTPQFGDAPAELRQATPCLGLLDDYLIATGNDALYKTAMTTAAGGSKSLADELDFKLIASKIKRQPGGKSASMISFNRPEEGMRMLYDMATAEGTRDQLRNGAENNPFFKSLNTALDKNPLPPFAVLRQYLAPGGAMVVDDETGIHYMAFSLKRK